MKKEKFVFYNLLLILFFVKPIFTESIYNHNYSLMNIQYDYNSSKALFLEVFSYTIQNYFNILRITNKDDNLTIKRIKYDNSQGGINIDTSQHMIDEDIANVKDYGVKGDGSNCTALIKKVLSNNNKVFFPKGIYLITGSTSLITECVAISNQEIWGEPGTILKVDFDIDEYRYLLTIPAKVYNVNIHDLTIDINSDESRSMCGIKIYGSNIIIDRCTFINTQNYSPSFQHVYYGLGILLCSSWSNVNVKNSFFTGGTYGILTASTSTGSGLNVSGCSFEYLSGDGICINVPKQGSFNNLRASNNRFRYIGCNNVLNNRGFGISLSGGISNTVSNVIISNSTFITVDWHGVHIEKGSFCVKVDNNIFDDCGYLSSKETSGAIAVITNCESRVKGISITNNTVYRNNITCNGIIITGSQFTKGIIVNNNTIIGNGNGTGIHIGYADKFLCSNNISKNNKVGIKVWASPNGFVLSNRCYDDQPVKTQDYGISYGGTANHYLEMVVMWKNKLNGNNISGFYAENNYNRNLMFNENIMDNEEYKK